MPLHVHETDGATDPLQVRPQFAQLGEISEVPKLRLAPGRDARAGTAYEIVHDELLLDGNARLNLATFVTTWMERDAEQLMAECSAKNMIDKDEYPQTAELERRCVNILADLWHATEEGGATGCSTTGSSEACMLGGLALKWRWRQRRQAAGKASDRPNLVMGANVQVCWEKFCRYWDVEARLVPVGPEATCLTAETAVAHCDENTIGVVAVLGSTYDGVYEPVAAIAAALDELAASRAEWTCPSTSTARRAGSSPPSSTPSWSGTSASRRVHSINTSGHKYGLVYPGVGWIIWRDQAALPDELVFNVDYLGGNMPTFALNFSRPGAQVVAQYYNFLRLGLRRLPPGAAGESGHRPAGWRTEISGLGPYELVSQGDGIPAFAFRIRDAPYTVFDVSDALRVTGWLVPAYTMPPALDARRRAAHRGAQRLQPRPGQHVDRGPQAGRRAPPRHPPGTQHRRRLPPLSQSGQRVQGRVSAGGSGPDRVRRHGPHRRSECAPGGDGSAQPGSMSKAAESRVAAAVIVDSEKGWAGQVWRPCPKTVTSSTAAKGRGSARRRRFQRSGSQDSSPGAALVLVSGSRVATVAPGADLVARRRRHRRSPAPGRSGP